MVGGLTTGRTVWVLSGWVYAGGRKFNRVGLDQVGMFKLDQVGTKLDRCIVFLHQFFGTLCFIQSPGRLPFIYISGR